MKTALFVLALILGVNLTAQQTIKSIASGSAINPLSWDCTCIPTQADSIVISHDIVLDIDFTVTSGSINVTASGTLTGDVATRIVGVTGTGSFHNSGTVTMGNFVASNGASIVSNAGTMNIDLGWYTTCFVSNNTNALIHGIDSMFHDQSGFFNGGHVVADNFLNNGEFDNLPNAGLTTINFANTDTFRCSGGSVSVTNFYNPGYYTMWNNSTMVCANNWANGDTVNADAVFHFTGASALVSIGGNFLNIDSIKGGAGNAICVTDSSANTGVMDGSFDFCDHSPFQPNIDLNLGIMASGITYCGTNGCNTGIASFKEVAMEIYPNPSEGEFYVSLPREVDQGVLHVIDISGRRVHTSNVYGKYTNRIQLDRIRPGVYFVDLTGDGYRGIERIVVR